MSDKRAAATRRKYGKPLCLDCEKKEIAQREAEITEPINDPAFVAQSVEKVRNRIRAGAGGIVPGQPQPVVKAMDATDHGEDYGVA